MFHEYEEFHVVRRSKRNCIEYNWKMTHSQLLEGLKCESQTKNNGRAKSQGTFLDLQHYKRVER